MLLTVVLLLAGIAGLVFSADILVRGASSIAKRLSVSDLVVGLTIVAFGTSAPELVINLVASSEGNAQVVFGNIIGSNIFNILGILGIAGLVRVLVVSKSTAWKEIPFVVGSGFLILLLVSDGWHGGTDRLSRFDGVILLAAFASFYFYVFRLAVRGRSKALAPTLSFDGIMPVYLGVLSVLAGLAGLFFGGQLVIGQAVVLASALGVSDRMIALTVVSAGTSFPELATSVVAAVRGKADIAVGNVVGSCIFNSLLVLGLSAVVCPLAWVGTSAMISDLLVMIGASLLLLAAMYTFGRRRLDRIEAGFFLVGIITYMVFVIQRG
jgi:cation:H+ antiporter